MILNGYYGALYTFQIDGMDDGFDLPVTYKGEELLFPAALVSFGWTHRIQVDVYGTTLLFERDEERAWRALLNSEQLDANKKIDTGLIKAIIDAIERVLA